MNPVPISAVLSVFISEFLAMRITPMLINSDCTVMLVRIRFAAGPKLRHKRSKNQHFSQVLAALLTPAAFMAAVLAFWRLAADLNATGQFPISDGLFSHWQAWLGAAATLQLFALALGRYGKAQTVLPKSVEEPGRKLANF